MGVLIAVATLLVSLTTVGVWHRSGLPVLGGALRFVGGALFGGSVTMLAFALRRGLWLFVATLIVSFVVLEYGVSAIASGGLIVGVDFVWLSRCLPPAGRS